METDDKQYDFTPLAAQALVLAGKEAKRLSHNFIGTEHLILGLVGLGEGTSAATLLKAFGVELNQVKTETEPLIGKGPDEMRLEKIPFTPRSKKVISLANKERETLGHKQVGTGHLILGILREDGGVAAKVLRKLDVDLETARERILELHPAETSTGETAGKIHEGPELDELFDAAEKVLEAPPRPLRIPRRVFAALCAVNDLALPEEIREDWFLGVLAHLRKPHLRQQKKG